MNNLELMRKRLEYQGGVKQEDRMIKDKYRTFLKTLMYSYQGCDIQLIQPYDKCYPTDPSQDKNLLTQDSQIHRALINPDKLKQDYDDKILSVDYTFGFGPGDVFTWIGTDSQWLIYLQSLTEDAYFRGEIRRCKYVIKFKDKDGIAKYTWAAIRGPVETQIESIQKNQNRIDVPNLSLNILIPKNDDTMSAFDRYSRFLFAGRCWKVTAPDSISVKNVIEVAAVEDYINEDTDNQEEELVNGLVIEKIDPNPPAEIEIHGSTFIRPKITETYEVDFLEGCWKVKENVPVYVEPIKNNGKNDIAITWTKMVSGQFTLIWTNGDLILEKVIVVESLF